MITNVAQYLDETVNKFPDKIAFVDSKRSITFETLKIEADKVATEICNGGYRKEPIIVFLEKSVEVVSTFLGIIKSGNFYSPIDVNMPVARIEKIIDTLQPKVIITDRKNSKIANEFAKGVPVLEYETCMETNADYGLLSDANDKILDSDLAYVLFTSGSTGIPKGVMISEKGLIDFVEWATDYFKINEKFIFGNQTPFYFSFSIYEIYLTIKNAATTFIIPHELFSYPGELMNYLFEHSINTIIWVPSALCMISTFRALKAPYLPELKRVLFGADVMQAKKLNRWISAYPNVEFYNLFGPTEVTDTCSAYKIERQINDNEAIPIGISCQNKEMLLLNEDDELVTGDEVGEICVRGSGMAYGYYNDEQRTKEVFVQNPLNNRYSEIIYRTGDLARYNELGELIYVSRKDFQIKHMGQRIELGEIETAIASIDGVERCCCLYDSKKSRIFMFYLGQIESTELIEKLRNIVPHYMVPNRSIKLEEMPFNLNGKIDRVKLKSEYID